MGIPNSGQVLNEPGMVLPPDPATRPVENIHGDTVVYGPDDGYRGFLKNPRTGRVFRANAVTAGRSDLIRVADPDPDAPLEPTVTTSKPIDMSAHVEPVEQQDDSTVSVEPEEQADALDLILAEVEDCEDKDELKAFGEQVGISLTKAMKVDTMRERIAERIETLREAVEE